MKAEIHAEELAAALQAVQAEIAGLTERAADLEAQADFATVARAVVGDAILPGESPLELLREADDLRRDARLLERTAATLGAAYLRQADKAGQIDGQSGD